MSNKIILLLGCFLIIHSTFSQDINDEIRELYEENKYDEVIKYVKHKKELSDTGCFYIGRAYYMKSDDENAIKFFDQSVLINPQFAKVYFFKAISLTYLKQNEKAHKSIDKAIYLDDKNPDYYVAKGNIYHNSGDKDSAFVYIKKATESMYADAGHFRKLGTIYRELDSLEMAKKSYLKAKLLIDEKSEEYIDCLYDLGLTYYLMFNYKEAEKLFTEIYELNPEDYHAISKLIQCHYAQKEYKKGNDLKPVLYKAYKKKKLPKNMKEMFCFDQFTWEDKRVLVFEKYDDPKDLGLYYKHIFYVMDKKGEIDYQVQTEWSAALEMSKKEYVLGMNKGNTHYTFFQFTFDKKFDYEKLKECVIQIFEGKVNATSSSTRGG